MSLRTQPCWLLLIVCLTGFSCKKYEALPDQSSAKEWFIKWKNFNPYKGETSIANFERNNSFLWDQQFIRNERVYVPIQLQASGNNDSLKVYKFISYALNETDYRKSKLTYYILEATIQLPVLELLTDIKWQQQQGKHLTIIEKEIGGLSLMENFKSGNIIAVKQSLNRNLPPSNECVSQVIDWYWQTFIDGVLVDEVYLFSSTEWICPSGSGSGGGGTDTVSQANPCDSVKKLALNSEFRDKMIYLKGKAGGNKEHAFYYRNTGNNTIDEEEFWGEPNVLGVDPPYPTSKIDGFMHNHFFKADSSQSIYSYADIWSLIDLYQSGYIADPYTFSAGLPTQNGNQYLLKIEDVAKFNEFANSYSSEDLVRSIFFLYQLKPDKTGHDFSAYNETQFLKLLNQRNTGLILFKGNATMNNWQSVKLNSSNQIEYIPCN